MSKGIIKEISIVKMTFNLANFPNSTPPALFNPIPTIVIPSSLTLPKLIVSELLSKVKISNLESLTFFMIITRG